MEHLVTVWGQTCCEVRERERERVGGVGVNPTNSDKSSASGHLKVAPDISGPVVSAFRCCICK